MSSSIWNIYRTEVSDDGMVVSTLFCDAYSIDAAGEIVNVLEKYSKKTSGKNYSYHIEKKFQNGTRRDISDLGCGA